MGQGGGGGGGGGRVGGCQGGWERRIEAFVKIQFFFFWGGGGTGGGRVGVGSDQGLGWGRWGSKVSGRRVMWGMGDVNQE